MTNSDEHSLLEDSIMIERWNFVENNNDIQTQTIVKPKA